VRPGDTLYGIEKARSGDASLDNWKRLYDMNRSRIKDPDLIYPGQELNVPLKGEAAKPAPKPTTPAPAPAPTAAYVLPVNAPITNPYGAPGPYASGHHTGVDFGAPQGTQVKAAAAGTVVASDTSPAYGTNVQIKHADGRYTFYAHLSLKAVTPGMQVNAGDLIGRVGNTGTNSSGPHLHFEVRSTPQYAGHMDPIAWLRSHGVKI
jgi:murein DD-endopeptidase MepM/ murein hydrolase activator NlpD